MKLRGWRSLPHPYLEREGKGKGGAPASTIALLSITRRASLLTTLNSAWISTNFPFLNAGKRNWKLRSAADGSVLEICKRLSFRCQKNSRKHYKIAFKWAVNTITTLSTLWERVLSRYPQKTTCVPQAAQSLLSKPESWKNKRKKKQLMKLRS